MPVAAVARGPSRRLPAVVWAVQDVREPGLALRDRALVVLVVLVVVLGQAAACWSAAAARLRWRYRALLFSRKFHPSIAVA